MNRRLIAQASLLSLMLIVQVGCQPQTPPTERAAELIEPELRPSLTITGQKDALPQAGLTPGHVIAFTFPDGLVALKAAAINDPFLDPEGLLTFIGVVEIGKGAQLLMPGVYAVALDLKDPNAEVIDGRLVPEVGDSPPRDLTFERIPTERNPDRKDDPSIPSINPVIPSDAVCFVIGFANGGIAPTAPDAQSWSRFCSQTSKDTNPPQRILSVRDNFASYGDLTGRWEELINRLTAFLKERGFPQEDANIAFDLTISEIEGHKNVENCNNNEGCESDFTAAPNILFWEQYEKAKENAKGNSFAVTAGIARIERTIDFGGGVLSEPGIYWVRVWIQDGKFHGIALLGVTDKDELVPGQSVPAIASYFIDTNEPQKIISWISAWLIPGNWCLGQRRC